MKNKGLIAKVSLFVLSLSLIGVFTSPVLATHTSTVTLIPSRLKCGDSATFIVNVTNTGGDPIREVRILNDSYDPIYHNYPNIPPHQGFTCGPAPPGWTLIDQHQYGFPYCQYQANSYNYYITAYTSRTFNFSAKVTDECNYTWAVETYDVYLAWQAHTPPIIVDCTPPNTTKNYTGPYKEVDGVEWISSNTLIYLNPRDDVGPHDTGINATYWRNTLVPDEYCWNPQLCVPCEKDQDNFQLYTQCRDGCKPPCPPFRLYEEPINKTKESCHRLEYFSVDGVNNKETVKVQCFFVDNTPPVGIKTIGEPKIPCDPRDPSGCDYWVRDHVTNITLDCKDQGRHPVNQETVCYRISFDEDQWLTDKYCQEFGGVMEGNWCCAYVGDKPYTFNFTEDSFHNLEFYCRDHLGNANKSIDIEYFKVDSTPPIINKTLIGPQEGNCPPEEGEKCWIKDWTCESEGTTIHVEAWDNDTYGCAVGNVTCEWWYELDGSPMRGGKGLTPPFDIEFYDESKHELHIKCCDKLGNCYEDVETFYVDSTGPNVTKEFMGPFYKEGEIEWIDGITKINLTASDGKGKCAVGVDKIYYNNTIVPDKYCLYPSKYCNANSKGPVWNEYVGPFSKNEESCHMLVYYAVDKLGNVGPLYANCFFVDLTPPTLTKTLIGPQEGNCPPEEGEDICFVRDHVTNITLDCKDQEPHPSNNEAIWYRILLDGNVLQDWTKNGNHVKITFTEDSKHTIEYYCVDAVNKSTPIHRETFYVDSTPPIINKTIGEPKVWKGRALYVRDHVTPITIDARDNESLGCAVDDVRCEWFIELDGVLINSSNGWIKPPFTIIFQKDSIHKLAIHCKDALWIDAWDNETFYVDSTPPITAKTYGFPCWPHSRSFCIEEYPMWISNETEIVLSAIDGGKICAVGVNQTFYRVTLVDDAYCHNETICQEAEGSGKWIDPDGEIGKVFTIKNESCHLIEYYSVDKLGNNETIHKQCVYVDTTGPEPLKEVGEPKTKWNGEDAVFYNISDKCWKEGGIECWKVTKLTPITLNCSDPGSHPVDHNRVCFKVEVDGEDKTSDYCPPYDHGFIMPLCTGEECEDDWEMENGYCCVNAPVESFYFKEETEHNLKFYCKDALGNKGDEDEEKFKVEGVKFEIPLYKKWNLISVPFVLLNDTPEEVFKNTENVTSVWTYDPEHVICGQDWCVWSPGDAPDNLKIEPGWGYWVLAKGDDLLVIGGSLMSPATTPPSRNLTKGWNLIGYYGVSWELYPYMSDFDYMCGDYFREPIQRYVYGDKSYCALFSLVDTQAGYPRWSALWSYLNCGGHIDFWIGLNACPDSEDHPILSKFSRMYAGRGYWIEMDVPDMYAPSTTCIWNEDYQCIWTGGGIVP